MEEKKAKHTHWQAKFPGQCSKCSGRIDKGHYIKWPRVKASQRTPGVPFAYHENCANPFTKGQCSECENPTPEHTPSPSYNTCKHGNIKPCSQCVNEAFEKQRQEQHEPNPDEAFKMEVPDQEPSFDDMPTPTPIPKSSNGTAGDGLLDIISSKVEAKVIDSVRRKVDQSIDAIDRRVKEKLDKLAIPSIEVRYPDKPSVTIHNVHKQFDEVLQLLVSGEYPYLHGAPGAGKTTLGPKLAEALGVRFESLMLCEQSPEYKVSGYSSPIDGEYFPSAFVDFYENGGLFYWSEIDNANDNLRTSLNTALDNGFLSTDKGLIRKHEKFYMLTDGNTCGRGAHPAFPSRTAFDAAFAARFIFVEFEYDWALCKSIALSINKYAGPFAEWSEKVSNWALANGVQLVMSPREVFKLAKLTKTTTIPNDRLLAGILRGLDVPSKEKMLSQFPFPNITRG
jgi:hypothetical protein